MFWVLSPLVPVLLFLILWSVKPLGIWCHDCWHEGFRWECFLSVQVFVLDPVTFSPSLIIYDFLVLLSHSAHGVPPLIQGTSTNHGIKKWEVSIIPVFAGFWVLAWGVTFFSFLVLGNDCLMFLFFLGLNIMFPSGLCQGFSLLFLQDPQSGWGLNLYCDYGLLCLPMMMGQVV